MRVRHAVPFFCCAALLVTAVAFGQVRGTSDRVIGVSEITPGMRGYGLTVFRGTEPERFDVEVIDVLHNFRPDQDLILIRTPHPILEDAHVVAGMSGSPIYLDGRLAGAYAYGWPFSQDPVAGVTPIANMMVEMRRAVRPEAFVGARPLAGRGLVPSRLAGPHLAGLPAYRGDPDVTATTALEAHAARVGALRTPSGTTLIPAATPLLLGGFDDAVVRLLDEQLGGFGLMALQAGGAGARTPPPNAPTAFVNGGAVGVQIVRGDIASTAVGTITYVEGGRAVAFGHPMLNAGQTSLPTALVRVLHILSSSNRSFKISEPIGPLGALVHDRQSGVVVDSGTTAATVQARVRITGIADAPRTEWNFEVASHRVLTPILLNAAILNAVAATASDSTDATFEATSRVWIDGRAGPETVVDRGYSQLGAANAATLRQLRLFALLEAIYGNPFAPAQATRVEIDIAIDYARQTVAILDAAVPALEVDPGATVPVRVVLRRFGRDEEIRIVPVRIPEHAAGQTVQIDIQPGPAVHLEHPQPRDLDELIRGVRERYSATSMVVSLQTPFRGLRFSGHVAHHLPSSALDSLQLTNDSDRNRPFVTFDRHEVGLDQVASGGARIEVTVRRTPR